MQIVPSSNLNDDDRPAAEIVADRFGFPLAYHDTDEGRFYAVQDWIAGVAQTDNPRRFWSDLKNRAEKTGYSQLYDSCVQLPYRAKNGKTYQMDYAPAEILYYITQRMSAETGIRDVVMKYLAKAGVLLDDIRSDPEAAAVAILDAADRKEYRKLIREGHTHEEALQWLDVRREQREERQRIVKIWAVRGVKGAKGFAILTNKTHQVAVGRTATEDRERMKIKKTARDYLSAAENACIQITETTAGMLHNTRNSYGMDELSEDIEDVRPIIDAARPEIMRVFSQKPRRLPGEKPKNLKSGK